jgi:hypothetical protein
MDASASPRKPYVVKRDKSENVDSFDVVNRSARMGKSVFYKSRQNVNITSGRFKWRLEE